jgi:hypothetical protein
MVNGSLNLLPRNRTGALEVLDWEKRLKIATGAARGLAFLHHGFVPHIIHREEQRKEHILTLTSVVLCRLSGASAVSNGVDWACIFV